METKPTAMISSTSLDLPEHRKQVMEACLRSSIFPVAMEHLPARDVGAVQVSLEMVDEADIYIGIYAWRYGWIPDDSEVSVTEMEFDRALERQKEGKTDILVFLMHEEHPTTRKMIEADAMAQQKLEAFKQRACQGRIRAEFKSPEELRGLVVQALADLKQRQQAESGKPAPQFHPPSQIPPAPEAYIAHPYTLLQSKDVIGRQAELNLLTDWVTVNRQVPSHVRLFHVVALGGMGKSALTWRWFNLVAPNEMPHLAGRLWWSFYESDAHYENFVIRALAYVAGMGESEARQLPINEREDRLLGLLDARPFLLVLDGIERILLAYARMDAAYLPDDDLDERTANILAEAYGLPDHVKETYLEKHRLRQCADPRAGRFLRRLAQTKASRVLVSTRLYPAELQSQTAQPLPGCAARFITGLTDDDALNLWREFGVSGSREELLPVFQAFGNYPLLLRALAGEVVEYRPAPGDFGRWRAAHPGFNPTAELDLRNAKTHVLHYALQGLGAEQRRVLHTLAGFRMPAGWETVRDLWLAGEADAADETAPAVIPAGNAGIQSQGSETTQSDDLLSNTGATGQLPSMALDSGIPCRNDDVSSFAGLKQALPEVQGRSDGISGLAGLTRASENQLDRILTELEDRGLVGWDRRINRYDLHPIVRGVVWAGLNGEAKQAIHRQLHGYFDAAPRPPNWLKVESLEDLTPAIELYHALIGLERYDEAVVVFRDHLEYATIFRLSASHQMAAWLERLFPYGLKDLPRLASARNRSYTLSALAVAYHFGGEPSRAGGLLQRSVKTYEAEQDERSVAIVLCNLSNSLFFSGQLYAAEVAARRALELGRKHENRHSEGSAGDFLGLASAAIDQVMVATIALRRSLTIWKVQKNLQGEGVVNGYLAQQQLWQGQPQAALPLARRAWDLAYIRRVENDFIRAARLHGEAALGLDDFSTAEERLHHVLSRARAVNFVEEELPALTALAELHRRRQEFGTARELLEQVWDAAERGPYPLFHADARNVLARIDRDLGQHEAAVAAATRAYQLAWCDGPPYAYHHGLTHACRLLQELGAAEPALPPFDESKHEPMPDVELNPRDEFYVEIDER